MYKCPVCNSSDIIIEKRPGGDCYCKDCHFKDKSEKFYSNKNGKCCKDCKNKNCPVQGIVSESALTCIHKK